jgi:hypothetical protein
MYEREWLRKARARARAGQLPKRTIHPPGFLKRGRTLGRKKAPRPQPLPTPEPQPRGRPKNPPKPLPDRNLDPSLELPKLPRGRPSADMERFTPRQRQEILYEKMYGRPWVEPALPRIPTLPIGRQEQAPPSPAAPEDYSWVPVPWSDSDDDSD